MTSQCPMDECRCEGWPPTECPQCGVPTIGFMPEDWYHHFVDDCKTSAAVFCFVSKPEEAEA